MQLRSWCCPSVRVSCADLISILYFSSVPRIQELKDNISHAVAAIKITTLHRVYLNTVTAQLLTDCSNTLRNIHTNSRENITRTHVQNGRRTTFSWPTLQINIALHYTTFCGYPVAIQRRSMCNWEAKLHRDKFFSANFRSCLSAVILPILRIFVYWGW